MVFRYEPERETSPWAYFIVLLIAAPLALLLLPTVFTGTIGFKGRKTVVSGRFRTAAAIASILGAWATYGLVVYLFPTLAPLPGCSSSEVTTLAEQILREKIIKLPTAQVTLSAIRTINHDDGLHCGASASISDAGLVIGERSVLYHVVRSDDAKSIYVTERLNTTD